MEGIKPTKFENAVMELMLQGNNPIKRILYEQWKNSKISKREYSGRGFFLHFDIPDNIPLVGGKKDFEIDDVDVSIPTIKYANGVILFIRNGKIDGVVNSLTKVGKNQNIRVVNSETELKGLFDRLSVGGKDITSPSYDGKMVQLPNGTNVGLRNDSTSGGPTIDIHPPTGKRLKIHVK